MGEKCVGNRAAMGRKTTKTDGQRTGGCSMGAKCTGGHGGGEKAKTVGQRTIGCSMGAKCTGGHGGAEERCGEGVGKPGKTLLEKLHSVAGEGGM